MTPFTYLALATLMTLHPAPADATTAKLPSAEAIVEGAEVEPSIDAMAVQAFVVDAADRYAGN
ncbi:MAG: hypothetical protein AAF393_10125 [Pseudomonadota bacterium]